MEDGEWETYRCRKRRRNKLPRIVDFDKIIENKHSIVELDSLNFQTVEDLYNSLENAKTILAKAYYPQVMRHIQGVPQLMKIDQIICFGLGNFAKDVISLTQLSFLMMLYDGLGLTNIMPIYDILYDAAEFPFPDPLAIEFLRVHEAARFDLLKENTSCYHPISAESQMTLFYLPHLDYAFIEKVIASNWTDLDRVVLFCTRLMDDTVPRSISNKPNDFPWLTKLLTNKSKYTFHHIVIEDNFELEGVFNDIDIFWFEGHY